MSAPSGPPFDPYQWPVFDKENSVNVVTQMINGMAIYEACMCLEAYFSICSKEKLKTAIFRLMTVAVVGNISGMVLSIMDVNSLTSKDLTVGDKEVAVGVISNLLTMAGRIGYYVAATLRSRALLSKRPTLLWSFYVLLVVCLLNNFALFGTLCHLWKLLRDIPPEALFQNFAKIMDAVTIIQKQACSCAAFDTVFTFVLMVTFLYPIYKNLQMEFRSVLMVLIKLGDVQKALFICATAALSAGTMFRGLDAQLPISAGQLCFLAQDTMFLRLSYKSTSELIARGSMAQTSHASKGGSNHTYSVSVQKSRIGPPPPASPSVVKSSAIV